MTIDEIQIAADAAGITDWDEHRLSCFADNIFSLTVRDIAEALDKHGEGRAAETLRQQMQELAVIRSVTSVFREVMQ